MHKERERSGCSSSMGAYEATKVVFARLQALEPNLAPKIIGMLLTKDNNEMDMIRLAHGPDNLLHSIIAKVRTDLTNKPSAPLASWGFMSSRGEEASFTVNKVGCDRGKTFFPMEYDWRLPMSGNHHRKFSPSTVDTRGLKPCFYFKQGVCNSGSTCRFLHGLSNGDGVDAKQEMLLMHAKAAAAQPQQMESTFPFSPSPKGLNLQLWQQQQSDSQRGVTMHLSSEDIQKYSSRPPQIDQSDQIDNRSARQIYLTFPADSIFSKEDVCNYFSIYGMVQDVRIPYQEKRMFGFVTFVCQKTVELILARGNPHYICDARVLVKPYKEKKNAPNKFSKFQQPHRSDFASYTITNRLIDYREPFDLQQRQIGSRILYRDMASHETFFRNLEEQQQVTELHGRCLMGLQLLNLQNRGHSLDSPMASHVPLGQVDSKDNVNENDNPIHLEDTTIQHNKLNSAVTIREIASTGISAEAKHMVNSREEGKRVFVSKAATPNDACGFLESGMEYNLPDSPFSSPTKASNVATAAHTSNINKSSPHMVASSLFPPNIHP